MSQSDDLSKLFQRFGGQAQAYQEIVRDEAATQARERWPLLSSVRVDRAATVPPVQPAGAPAQDGAAAVPPWRGLATERAPAPAEAPATAAQVAPAPLEAPAAAPGAAMEPRFRTPGGAPPARFADLAPAAEPVRPPPPAWEPAAQAAPPAPPAPPASEADTELSRIFARLEGRPEPAPASERPPARRSFLDRLNRS
ncbi:cellulose biosynthesis protein BcsP [Cupriavidus sp. 30B13]|uniref:cellulose biosynthesis protein BcsP n=1 Tax=Cupriavidus sp. 30B13 TaxID=3384241 RepID=UPI003B91B4CB